MRGLFGKIWKDPVGSGIIIFLITGLLGWFGNKLSDGWVWTALQTIWEWIVAFLLFEIAVLWILLGVAILILGLYIWVKISVRRQNVQQLPSFFSYTSDTFNGYKYEWSYSKDYISNKYQIDYNSMRIICSKCGTAIYELEYPSCPRCSNRDFRMLKSARDIILVIEDNIRREKYGTK